MRLLTTDALHVEPAYREALRAARLASVEDALAHLGASVAAWSRSTDTVLVPAGAGRPGFYVKRYYYPDWSRRLRGAMRGTFFGQHRALAEYRSLRAMCQRGIPAARPVAWGARRCAHFVCASVLITEEVPGARSLTSFASDLRAGRAALSGRTRLLLCRRLAEQVAAMHAAGFVHGALFWRNILVRIVDEEPEFFFLDARPPASLRRFTSTRWRTPDLSALAASASAFTSRSERLRFGLFYLGTDRPSAAERALLRDAERGAAAFARHEAQRIRMAEQFDAWNRRMAQVPADTLLLRPSVSASDSAGGGVP